MNMDNPLKNIGKSKEAPKVIVVVSALYFWKDALGKTSVIEMPFNVLILLSVFTLIVTLAGLVFIYKQKKKI